MDPVFQDIATGFPDLVARDPLPWHAVQALYRELLEPCCACIGLELRLDEPCGPIDYSFFVMEREFPTFLDRLNALPASWREQPAWRGLIACIRGALDPSAPWAGRFRGLWLEWDRQDLLNHAPVPSIFLSLKNLGRFPEGEDLQADWLLEGALPTLLGRSLAPETRRLVARCLETLPTPGLINHAGAMLSRPTRALRLCVGMAMGRYPGYLKHLGWEGDPRLLLQDLAQIQSRCPAAILSMNVSDRVDLGIGFECFPPEDDPEGLRRLLGLAQSRGLVHPLQRKRIQRWVRPGDGPHKRTFTHLKLMHQGRAKAYLALMRRAFYEPSA